MQVNYIVSWDKTDKTRTWSGTAYSLFCAMQKYADIIDININESVSFFQKVKNIFRYGRISNTSSVPQIKALRKKLNKLCSNSTVFQFVEYVDDSSADSYIYLDASVEYLYNFYKTDKERFLLSGLGTPNMPSFRDRLKLQQEYFKKASGIFCMGDWLKKYMVSECGVPESKIHVAGGGINIDKTQINPDKNKTNSKILFIGRDFQRKGGYITVEAFKLLKAKKPTAELYIVGPMDNPLSEDIPGVIFLGEQSHDKISSLFNKCDLFCMPSYYEAYGLVFIEALCSGLPCIGRNCYEMPYFIESGITGMLLNEDSAEELAGLMVTILENNSFKANVQAKQQWYLEHYSWDSVAKRIFNVIQK